MIRVAGRVSYRRYKEAIEQLCAAAERDLLHAFCADVVLRILPFAETADRSGLREQERELTSDLFEMLRHDRLDWHKVRASLNGLTEIAEQDEVHAIEMESDLVELLCALDNWRSLRETGDPRFAADVSENMMNVLDHHFADGVPLDEWLSVPEIDRELSVQLAFLEEGRA